MRYLSMIILSTIYIFGSIGYISAMRGEVLLERDKSNSKAFKGLQVENKDILQTGKRAKAQIIFQDNTVITLGARTKLKINDYLFNNGLNSKANFKVNYGFFDVITGQIGKIDRKRFKFHTNVSMIGIRGTHFQGIIKEKSEQVICLKGSIIVQVGKKIVQVLAGKMVEIQNGLLSIPKKFEGIVSETVTAKKEIKDNIYSFASQFHNIADVKIGDIELKKNLDNLDRVKKFQPPNPINQKEKISEHNTVTDKNLNLFWWGVVIFTAF